ncbi:lipocalin family protein [Chryseobacterium sp. HR92]|uniref:lipocalin family protein n=1 Tax=Chryseobacterium sp. HR92 TaxID=3094839 RepID=UPI00388ECE0A|nr:lipocalin family protein [Chryseobacterium sp. HR92]
MKKAISLVILGVLASCNPSTQNKNLKESTETSSDPNSQKTKLIGKWLQPIPGQEKEKQGFELNENGVAASVNIHTLLYDKWKVSDDTLFLWYHTAGVRQVSNDIDTLLIKKLSDDQLIISYLRNPNFELVYNKGK